MFAEGTTAPQHHTLSYINRGNGSIAHENLRNIGDIGLDYQALITQLAIDNVPVLEIRHPSGAPSLTSPP